MRDRSVLPRRPRKNPTVVDLWKWKLDRSMQHRSSRLVERDDEVALGTQMARAAASGTGGLLVVRGPAGIGKTELSTKEIAPRTGSARGEAACLSVQS